MATARQLEKEALRHAKEQAREEARQQILQAKIDREFRKSQEATARQIDWDEHGWKRIRTVLYWTFITLFSLPFAGIPLALALAWHFWKKRR